MTRADWYARNTGGGWRTARLNHRCDRTEYGLRCMAVIAPGTKYFDTNQHNPNGRHQHAKIRLCVACAEQELTK